MVYGQYEAALLFSDRHKAGARKMENRWSLIAKPTLKTMQRKPTSIRQQMSDTIHNHISKLRKKLRFEPDLPNYIESVAGIGYKFEHL